MRGAGAQDALLKFPWNVHPSYLSVSSSHGGKSSGEIRCAWSSVWRRLFVSTGASGEVQATERDWEEYFANPLQWWDNRFYKMNPSSLDFEHKVTKKVLWVDSCSTPPWVKAMLKLMTLGDEPSPGGYHTSDSQ